MKPLARQFRLQRSRPYYSVSPLYNLDIQQTDVDRAFLYANTQEEIYMTQPEGFIKDLLMALVLFVFSRKQYMVSSNLPLNGMPLFIISSLVTNFVNSNVTLVATHFYEIALLPTIILQHMWMVSFSSATT